MLGNRVLVGRPVHHTRVSRRTSRRVVQDVLHCLHHGLPQCHAIIQQQRCGMRVLTPQALQCFVQSVLTRGVAALVLPGLVLEAVSFGFASPFWQAVVCEGGYLFLRRLELRRELFGSGPSRL